MKNPDEIRIIDKTEGAIIGEALKDYCNKLYGNIKTDRDAIWLEWAQAQEIMHDILNWVYAGND